MAIEKQLETQFSSSIKSSYWTVGYAELLPKSNGDVTIRYRLEGYVTEEDYRNGKQSLDTRHTQITMKKTDIPVWELFYDIAKEQISELSDGKQI
jgi:hypothetical protein